MLKKEKQEIILKRLDAILKPRGYAWQFDTDFLVYTWYRNTNSLLQHILNSHFLLQRIDKQAQLVQHCESTQKRVVHEGMDGDFRTRRISKFAMTLNFRSAWGKCKNAFV